MVRDGKVIPILEAHSFHVTAVQNLLTFLSDDVNATRRIIAIQDGPVIPCWAFVGGQRHSAVVLTEEVPHCYETLADRVRVQSIGRIGYIRILLICSARRRRTTADSGARAH